MYDPMIYLFPKRGCEHYGALNTHVVYVSFILEAGGRSHAEIQNRLIEVIAYNVPGNA